MDLAERADTPDAPLTVSNSVETLKPTKSLDINLKTEQYVETIENKVDELYTSLERNTSTGWKSFNGFLTNFQKNIPEYVNQTKDRLEKLTVLDLDAAAAAAAGTKNESEPAQLGGVLNKIKSSTTTYLDELDDDLQEVEKLVGGFAWRFGSFIKDTVIRGDVKNGSQDNDADEIEGAEADVLFNVPDQKLFGTRAEQRLHQLNNSKDLYVTEPLNKTNFNTFTKNFKIDKETIENALKESDLSKLYTRIVPSEISADQFWLMYFYNKSLIDNEENTKKKLLSETNTQDEDKFNWDDDDEEEPELAENAALTETQQSRSSSEVTYNLESANSSTLDVVASKRPSEKSEDKKDDEEEEEEEDWE